MITNLVYIIWASGEVQWWNSPKQGNQSVEAVADVQKELEVTKSDIKVDDSKLYEKDEKDE